MPCHHAQHVQNVGPNLFVHNENSAYIMPHAHRQASCPYENVVCQKLLMDTPFVLAKLNLIKYPPHILAPIINMRIANQNILKMILIAMHNENKADYNENFRICAEESIGALYKR